MITRQKLSEYIWAGGDIDGYSRSGRHSDITDEDWSVIDRTLSAITILRRGLGADSFRRQHEECIGKVFDSMETYELLVKYEAQKRT